jgi:hypothetical protein
MRRLLLALLTAAPLGLAGCDMLGIESATAVAARREAEGKAIGAGCRQAARSVEDCYENNKRADKAAIFAGWREMSDYMRENKMEPTPAPAEPVVAATTDDAAGPDKAEAKGETRTDAKSDAKTDAKGGSKPAPKSATKAGVGAKR